MCVEEDDTLISPTFAKVVGPQAVVSDEGPRGEKGKWPISAAQSEVQQIWQRGRGLPKSLKKGVPFETRVCFNDRIIEITSVLRS